MYRMVGADGRQYGPVTAPQLREWVAQGRANAQTLVQPEGSTEWRPLANFPELGAFAPPVPPPIAPTVAPVRVPGADQKIAAGVCGILLGGLGIHKFILGYTGEGVTMLLVSGLGGIVTCGLAAGAMHIIGLVEGIIYLTKTDEEFVATYVAHKKGWF